ncbi:uncharacterized protein B0I36DRAFT_322101 [Microdochium trichocladiopsis]|uniref:Rhodopsin domain-containing protein n=1 Tax=Microdochium trichocladiopsis TaxID=1682393 RepID=A0A9P9BQ60_9PEZI|nr:uncharacterized protein B0I36DRAFT_322101 [Microdochium trichocladiopsis]KAH7030602.1 hypothetical protein B0I36DRAFT_322101 [Microdochium trichocladiopsis]
MDSQPQTQPGDDSRFSPIYEDDHAGYIWIVGIIALIYSLSATIARVFVKFRLFGTDDYLLVASTVLHVAQSIAVFAGVSGGLGKFNSITTPEQWASAGKAYYAADVFLFLALCLSKCSILGLILRVVESKTSIMRRLCLATIGLSLLWGVLSVLLATVGCPAESVLASARAGCPAQEARWITIAILDIITEIAICVFPIALVWRVNMRVSLKFQVVAAFMFRIPLVPLAIVRLYLLNANAGSTEPLFAATDVVSVNQVILCWSIISANIPNLKQFLKSFFTGLGYPLNLDGTTSGGMYDNSRGNSYAMRSLKRSGGRSGGVSATTTRITMGGADQDDGHHGPDRTMSLRPADHEHKAHVQLHRKESGARYGSSRSTGEGSDNDGHSRTGSQEMIIRREVEWQVTHEDRM